jgi:hypothetical protein
MASKREQKENSSYVESLKKASLAIEDLLFSIQQVRPKQLQDAISILNSVVMDSKSRANSAVAKSYQSADPNKRFLIGALPRLLLDRDLFPSNEDIVDFAKVALRLEMTRTVEKRARHEIIGKIVCETETLDEQQLTDLVKALELIVGNKDRLAVMIEKKKSGTFSWNETLQELLRS